MAQAPSRRRATARTARSTGCGSLGARGAAAPVVGLGSVPDQELATLPSMEARTVRGPEEETGEPCNESKTCRSGTLSYASIDGNDLDDVDIEGTPLDERGHTLSSCAQVILVQYSTSSLWLDRN